MFTNATFFQELPDWLKDITRKNVERSHQLAISPYTEYRGQRLASIPEEMKRAHQISTRTETYLPHLRQTERILGQTGQTFPSHYQEYLNPYTKAVVNQISEEGNRTFLEKILPQLDAMFVKAGHHGSTHHAKLARHAARDIQRDILDKQQQALAHGYQQAAQIYGSDQARKLETARELKGLGGLYQAGQIGDISMLGEAGRYKQQQEQAARDIAYNDFLRAQNYPHQMLQQQTAILHGTTPPSISETHYAPATPQTSILGQLSNLAGNIYNASKISQ
jgi:hypothetical protein